MSDSGNFQNFPFIIFIGSYDHKTLEIDPVAGYPVVVD